MMRHGPHQQEHRDCRERKFGGEIERLERELEIALKQLPNRKQFEDLLQDITTAGKKVGVTIKSIERTEEIEHDFYAEVPFLIALEGSYHNIAIKKGTSA